MATLKNTNIAGSQYLKIPSGGSGDRPSPATAGMMRYNTDTGFVEEYNGSSWNNFTEKKVSEPASLRYSQSHVLQYRKDLALATHGVG